MGPGEGLLDVKRALDVGDLAGDPGQPFLGGSLDEGSKPRPDGVLLTVIHRRLPDRDTTLMFGAGWHAHLDLLAARIAGTPPSEPFWDAWSRLRGEYDRRVPA